MRVASLLIFIAASAIAQVQLSGDWTPYQHEDQIERGPGPDLGDYLGIPINDAARLRAESWDASRLTLQEHQCRVHVAPYIFRGPLALRIWEEKDPDTQQVVAIRNYISTYEQSRTIWMDGRPHPPDYAPHTWMGFSTGKWEGNILTVETTHMKNGWLRRNGLPESDLATMTEHFARHDNVLTHTTIVYDPAYLAAPLIRTEDFVLNLTGQTNWLWPCEYVQELSNNRPQGAVPHYLPGENPFLKEFGARFHVPDEPIHGGPETIYPEYRTNMRRSSVPGPLSPNRAPAAPRTDVEIFPVQGGVSMLVGAGANITTQVGGQGVLLVDSGSGRLSAQVIAAVKKLSDKPIRYIVNTSGDAAHSGGNQTIAEAIGGGASSLPVQNTPGATLSQAVQILAHDNVLNRMTAASAPANAWPTETFVNQEKELYFNGEAVRIYHVPAAHTDGDSLVYFRKSDVIAAGELFVTGRYPIIDLAKGGSLKGMIEGLNLILDIAVPAHHQEGGTMIVSGEGRLCDEADVVEFRDMLVIIRDRVQALIKKGLTLEQIQAARPSSDYDPIYGATSGPWTTSMFIEAVYQSLK